jgi:CHAD domain-containing protein
MTAAMPPLALRTDEDLAVDLRRAAAERAAAAVEAARGAAELRAEDVDPDAEDAWDRAVHDARKRCKEVRAVARLCRDALGGRAYRSTNAAFRDAARLLSPARDAWTLLRTARGLRGDAPDEAPAAPDAAVDVVQAALLDRYRRLRAQAAAEGLVPRALVALQAAAAEVAAWELDPRLRPRDLRAALERTYRDARTTWDGIAGTVEGDPSAHGEEWHECRKHVKHCWYQVQALQAAWPGPLGALEGALDELSDVFGDEHDLAVLVESLRSGPMPGDAGPLDLGAADGVVEAALARRQALRRRAAGLAPLVLAEPAKAYARRLTAYARAVPRWQDPWGESPQGS